MRRTDIEPRLAIGSKIDPATKTALQIMSLTDKSGAIADILDDPFATALIERATRHARFNFGGDLARQLLANADFIRENGTDTYGPHLHSDAEYELTHATYDWLVVNSEADATIKDVKRMVRNAGITSYLVHAMTETGSSGEWTLDRTRRYLDDNTIPSECELLAQQCVTQMEANHVR